MSTLENKLSAFGIAHEYAKVAISSGLAYTKPEIISEVVCILNRVYQMDKSFIQASIHALLNDISCTERECVLTAIDIYASISLDFADCLLIAYHRINGETIFSFNKKLNKHLDTP